MTRIIVAISVSVLLASSAEAKTKRKKPAAKPAAAVVEQPAAPPATQTAPAPAPDAPKTVVAAPETPPGSMNLNFDLLAPAPVENQAEIEKTEHAVKLRRNLLKAHLILGFTLLGALGATEVLGALNYYDKFGGGGYTNRYDTWHEGFAIGSTVIFAGQAGLALFAPNPYPKPAGWTASRFHRIAMAMAAVGIATDIVLGPISETRFGLADQQQFATAHLVIGTVTYALVIAGVLAWLAA